MIDKETMGLIENFLQKEFIEKFEEIIKHQSDIYTEDCPDEDNCKLCKEFSELDKIIKKYNFIFTLLKKWDYDD